MKDRKLQKILLILSFIFLSLLLYIQISRLITTAETEKRHFAQSVKLSLDLVAKEITEDRQMCRNVQICLMDTSSNFISTLRKNEWNKVDSIINVNLEYYNIDLAYEFEIVYSNSGSINFEDKCEVCYAENLNIALNSRGVELRVKFPEKNKFIIERISTMFISSILLILLLMASFILTFKMYTQEQKLAAQTKSFINNMAHEFKTPLASIGFANSRIRNNQEIDLTSKIIKYTEIIETEKSKLQQHLGCLLDLASLESKKSILEFETIELKSLLQEVISNSCIALEEKKGQIVFNCNAENTYINGSRMHLINSFANIVENACKYSNGNLLIDIKCFNKDSQIVTEISDNGIGIAHKEQKLIFDKFYRVSTGNIHDIKGYGIGLSYVNEVVTLHKGKIGLKSKPGVGSTFKISIPNIIDN